MSTRTVKVSNVSLNASEQHVEGYFSISGDIEYVEMRSADECSQIAYVTFKDSQGAENALLLSDAKIDGQSVVITAATDYELPPAASDPQEDAKIDGQSVVITAATDYQLPPAASDPQESHGGSRSSVLDKGFSLSKHAVKKAIIFAWKHGPRFSIGTQVPICGKSFNVGLEK
ncbi:binding partner of ACD11 1 isoform X2 [Elaeis guineensis]|uniref:Binding partner of ACD11 1 isoform X2 n=1 Tax=Elaeis guineensis var. tenera TaxID=51953 RepID=A0A8N4EZE4_ELAGV|nr:binding partner of ACD11 1 isoform X2 [Elaeis guineensis]